MDSGRNGGRVRKRGVVIAALALVLVPVGARAWTSVSEAPSAEQPAPAAPASSAPPVSASEPRPTNAEGSTSPGIAVASVTDGDTLDLADGRTIRLAQVDAPERNECFGSQSTAALRALVDGKTVTLRRPADAPAKDKYGRTLAELYVDGVSVDETLIRDGAAEWYEQFAHEDADLAARLQAAEQDASAARRGLWSACNGSTPAPSAPTTAPAPRALVGAPTGGNCHPSYPDDCIPPAPPDLDCASIGHRVRVDQSHGDPHRLDADRDGWGCESYG
jgi:micrococcal nuclease